MTRSVSVLAAMDRFNYGDLLFAHMIEEGMRDNSIQYDYYGLVKSDMSDEGAKKTDSIRSLYKKIRRQKHPVVIVAGGEAIGASWRMLYGYINGTFRNTNRIPYLKNVLYKDDVARKLLGGKSSLPFVIPVKEINAELTVIYNSVGAVYLPKDQKILQDLKAAMLSAAYVAVRDNISLKNIRSLGIVDCKLVPDTAVLMSTLFGDKLKDLINKDRVKEIAGFLQGYIVFQIGKDLVKGKLPLIESQLQQIQKETGLPIVFCPIGRALGHEDQIPLKALKDSGKLDCVLLDNLSIWEIMWVIANAKLFIGTSLHGYVTSMSFRVPYIGIYKSLKKQNSYLNTWAVSDLKDMIEVEDLTVRYKAALHMDKSILEENFNMQKALVIQSFEKIKSIIRNTH